MNFTDKERRKKTILIHFASDGSDRLRGQPDPRIPPTGDLVERSDLYSARTVVQLVLSLWRSIYPPNRAPTIRPLQHCCATAAALSIFFYSKKNSFLCKSSIMQSATDVRSSCVFTMAIGRCVHQDAPATDRHVNTQLTSRYFIKYEK